MQTGMMWFDNDPKKNISLRVAEAAQYYLHKYGSVPTTCLVNPAMLPGGEMRISDVDLKPAKWIMPNSYWIGREETL